MLPFFLMVVALSLAQRNLCLCLFPTSAVSVRASSLGAIPCVPPSVSSKQTALLLPIRSYHLPRMNLGFFLFLALALALVVLPFARLGGSRMSAFRRASVPIYPGS